MENLEHWLERLDLLLQTHLCLELIKEIGTDFDTEQGTSMDGDPLLQLFLKSL